MTEPFKQFLFILSAILTLAILIVAFNADYVAKLLERKPMAVAESNQGDTVLESFDYTHWQLKKGQTSKEYSITADALGFAGTSWGMLTFNWFKNMVVYNPTIQFFRHDREFSRIIAGKAYLKIPQHNYQEALSEGAFVFEDNPQLVSSNGKILTCSRFNWQRQTNTIKGSEGCQLMSNNGILQVNDILVNLNLDVL